MASSSPGGGFQICQQVQGFIWVLLGQAYARHREELQFPAERRAVGARGSFTLSSPSPCSSQIPPGHPQLDPVGVQDGFELGEEPALLPCLSGLFEFGRGSLYISPGVEHAGLDKMGEGQVTGVFPTLHLLEAISNQAVGGIQIVPLTQEVGQADIDAGYVAELLAAPPVRRL